MHIYEYEYVYIIAACSCMTSMEACESETLSHTHHLQLTRVCVGYFLSIAIIR